MFTKLLKHEWRATRSVIGLLCAIILIAGLTVGGVMYYMLITQAQEAENVSMAEDGFALVIEDEELEEAGMSDMAMVVCMVLLSCGIMAIAVCCAAAVFFMVYRFYKRCFTDEGYLTFTLPVSNHQILLSSILISVAGTVVVILAAAAAAGIIFGMFLLAINNIHTIGWADVWVAWEGVWIQLRDSFVENLDAFALVGFSTVTAALSELITFMLAVSVGALIAKKHKILAAVAAYYGISFLRSLAYSVPMIKAVAGQDAVRMLGMPGVMSLLFGVAGYFLMHWLISRKLNLV